MTTTVKLELTTDEARALWSLASNSADDGLDEFFSYLPSMVAPAGSALEKLHKAQKVAA